MDKEKEWTLIIEQANIQMKLALKGGVIDTVEKEVIKTNVRKLIDDTKSSLKLKDAPKDLIDKVEKTLKLRFVDWYNYITAEILKGAQASKNPLLFKKYQDITGEKLKPSKGMNLNIDGYDIGSIDNVEDYVTTGRTAGAQNFIDDYVDKVKKAMHTIADKNLVMRDRLGRKLSLRNLAEMTARFEQQQEKLKQLKDAGIEYVVASSHSNASERCQIWQGKVFIIDCEVGATFKQTVDLSYRPTALGKIDGIDYYSLKDAMLHGFLGYNCRHRLVKYTKGMDLFNEYDAHTIATERSLEAKQRYLERKIREMKQKAVLAIDPNERKKYTLQSKRYQEIYATYCHNKGLVRYDWRTRITKVERSINVDYGEDLTVLDEVDSIQEPSPKLDDFKPVTTVQEAEEYARNTLGISIVSYKGIDVRVANDMNEALHDLLNFAPEAKQRLNAIGSAQEINKIMRKDFEDYYYNLLKSKPNYGNCSDLMLRAYAQKFARRTVGSVPARTYAFAISGGSKGNPEEVNTILEKYKGIFINNAFGQDPKQFEESTMRCEESRFHPIGCGTIKSVFDHECGHILDYTLRLRDNPNVQEIFDSYKKSGIISMTEDLSRYAWDNKNKNSKNNDWYAEMIAEAYSEYKNNPKPREIASKIGAIIEDLVRRGK